MSFTRIQNWICHRLLSRIIMSVTFSELVVIWKFTNYTAILVDLVVFPINCLANSSDLSKASFSAQCVQRVQNNQNSKTTTKEHYARDKRTQQDNRIVWDFRPSILCINKLVCKYLWASFYESSYSSNSTWEGLQLDCIFELPRTINWVVFVWFMLCTIRMFA